MDKLLSAFLHSAERPKLSMPQSNVIMGAVDSDDDSSIGGEDPNDIQDNYISVETYRLKEQELYLTNSRNRIQMHEEMSMVDDMDDISSMAHEEVQGLVKKIALNVYTTYTFSNVRTERLPIDSYRDEILSMVNAYPVVVIQGPTGCGKTTQVAQFILDDCRTRNRPCNIVVTQPRRIAAVSVARRVATERAWQVGSVVGYQVGLEPNKGRDTILLYVTTGVLLQKLVREGNLAEYTHVIIDEVHERETIMDFLLMVVRRFLFTNSPLTKVILMSATFDETKFAHYFASWYTTSKEGDPAPIIRIDQPNQFRTQIFYTNQLHYICESPEFKFEDPHLDKSLYKVLVILIAAFDKLDLEDTATHEQIIGSVLVFLPGIFEIEEAYTHLEEVNAKRRETIKWRILPLHSSLTSDEQRLAFVNAPAGYRKIILSTNIAESSITVPDITYVVDFCLTKAMVLNAGSQYQSLQLKWASHDNCTQRAGRVGRVADGRVYRLVSYEFYHNHLPKTSDPEILRAPLDRVVLASKLLDINEPPRALLSLVMDPPNIGNINNTVLFLKEIGALTRLMNGELKSFDGNLTPLGRIMENLPINIQLSKLIVMGYMFSCLEECIIMAAGCSLNQIFTTPFQKRLEAYMNRLQWADGSASDLIAYLNVYRVWKQRQAVTTNRDTSHSDWLRLHYVNRRALREWEILIKEIRQRLPQCGIELPDGVQHVVYTDQERPTAIKAAICGAFYPNYFLRSSIGGQVDEREAVKTLSGRDPRNTVYFTGFPQNQPGVLYAKHIRKYFSRISDQMKVEFDSSSKVYVEFIEKNQMKSVTVDGQILFTAMPGTILTEVYNAVRIRQLNIPCVIPIIQADKAHQMLKNLGIDSKMTATYSLATQRNSILPKNDIEYIMIRICEVVSAGNFWAHNVDDTTHSVLLHLDNELNERPLKRVHQVKEVTPGGIYAAKFVDDDRFYRCTVLSITKLDMDPIAHIIFIDYGNVSSVRIHELFYLPKTDVMGSPAQAFECRLSGVQPSSVRNPRSLWSHKANDFLMHHKNTDLFAKVYSVVNGVAHLQLFKNANYTGTSFNDYLIQIGEAEPAEETFLSKENHFKREQIQHAPEYNYNEDANDMDVDEVIMVMDEEEAAAGAAASGSDVVLLERKPNVHAHDVEPPRDCAQSETLRGPFNPLETNVYSMVQSGAKINARIEGSSVNAVLLDTDPQDPHSRLLVALDVGQSAVTESLILRHTTIMPKIPGFPMLMALLFCPIMEPKPTKDGTRIAAILCGLGAHDDHTHSVYPAHDICLTLDTILNEQELLTVNKIRYWMNMAIAAIDSTSKQQVSPIEIGQCQLEIKSKLFELLDIKREASEPDYLHKADRWGKTEYNATILLPGNETSMMKGCIWPLHWTITLKQKTKEREELDKNLVQLNSIARQAFPINQILCQLCQETFCSTSSLKLHISSAAHKQKVKELQESTV